MFEKCGTAVDIIGNEMHGESGFGEFSFCERFSDSLMHALPVHSRATEPAVELGEKRGVDVEGLLWIEAVHQLEPAGERNPLRATCLHERMVVLRIIRAGKIDERNAESLRTLSHAAVFVIRDDRNDVGTQDSVLSRGNEGLKSASPVVGCAGSENYDFGLHRDTIADMKEVFKRKKILLLGSGELGKEVAIEAMRLGCEVVACDRYEGAPAQQIAQRHYTFSMLDGAKIREVVEKEKPDLIVPEIEAIATQTLVELEKEGWRVIPTARATRLTMDRQGIRQLAAEQLKLPTSPYRFAGSLAELKAGAQAVGFPCFIKPTMSSSGHGQSMVKKPQDLKKAWDFAMEDARGKTSKVIVEGKINFDYEITLLTVRHKNGISFCAPIGHIQIDGDYRESWQPHPMTKKALANAQSIAKKVVNELCGKKGRGIFGVELFVKGDKVWFSEVSPRPHDTGMVTMVSQTMSEMELHVRAILELPIPEIPCRAGASVPILAEIKTDNPAYEDVADALKTPGTWVRIFGKPSSPGHRRMAVALAIGKDVKEARKKANAAAKKVRVV
jgi:phosphoribosylglycinamide formyltransferase 2